MSIFAHNSNFADRRALACHPPAACLLRRFLQWRQRQAELAIAFHLRPHRRDASPTKSERRMTERLTSGGGFRS